ncbi:hypothetical protein KSC_001090 [Ktedonobacter sp. SOSP1-52]|uniref:protein-L-isoaspartate O-methyltransferase family protein n=1 Tax=Ktedonobacter sp. SOSP1-52 TaxID=2778366 RepID=UPI0019169B6E|nr:methyltransferase domain-containing protein [Ktedonobacter sp. SOSP1-52]GHO61217.1 hypothetical protein KSC_001090 [Ktedonobacter sp. SOSP1-52]
MRQPKTAHYRQQLVENIETSLGHQLSPLVRDAFLTIPREIFVNQYYRQRGNTLDWDVILNPTLEELYQDCYLVTRINERKISSSSSSQPSIMAAQLEALALAPGQRVLEIGSGTGYNAGLMAHMVKPMGTVVSVDIAEDLVLRAADRLRNAGIINVQAFVADGYEGYAPYAPYDRLLATCSVPAIPPSWAQQLREGGGLIANVHLPLASIFVYIEKVGDAGVGTFLPIRASYMRLAGPNSGPLFPKFHWKELSTLPKQTLQLEEDLEILLKKSNGFAVLLHCFCPTLTKAYFRPSDQQEQPYALYLISQPQHETIVCVQKDCLTFYGQAEPIRSGIQSCLQTYHDLGDPQVEEYALSLHEMAMTISLNGQEFSLPQLMDTHLLS